MASEARARTYACAALLLVAAACGEAPVAPAPDPAPPASDAPISPAPADSETPEPAKILRFEAPNLAGGVVRGTDYAGKDLALWFWAPW